MFLGRPGQAQGQMVQNGSLVKEQMTIKSLQSQTLEQCWSKLPFRSPWTNHSGTGTTLYTRDGKLPTYT